MVTAAADPITMPLLSSETLDARCVDHNYTRAKKTLLVDEMPLAHFMLDVCTHPDQPHNCSRCEKCLRAMLTLEIGGKLEHFASVFDLDVYARMRRRYIRSVL